MTRTKPHKPVPTRLLRGGVWVEEYSAEPMPPRRDAVILGLHSDGMPYAVFATRADRVIHLYTPGRRVLRVSLECLIDTMLAARPARPKPRRKTS